MTERLDHMSIHQLRAIAQSFGVPDVFKLDTNQLIQAIHLKQETLVTPAPQPVPRPEYDARLMWKVPSQTCTQEEATEVLQGHMERGLHVTFPDPDRWHMQYGKKEDTGTLRMPLRTLLNCADKMLV